VKKGEGVRKNEIRKSKVDSEGNVDVEVMRRGEGRSTSLEVITA